MEAFLIPYVQWLSFSVLASGRFIEKFLLVLCSWLKVCKIPVRNLFMNIVIRLYDFADISIPDWIR